MSRGMPGPVEEDSTGAFRDCEHRRQLKPWESHYRILKCIYQGFHPCLRFPATLTVFPALTSMSFWKYLNPNFSSIIEYLPGATPVIETGVEPFRSGLPELPSSWRISSTAAPSGVDVTSIVPPEGSTVALGVPTGLLAFALVGVVWLPG